MKYLQLLIKLLITFMLAASFFIAGCSSDTITEAPVPNITTTDSDGATSVDENALNDVLDTFVPPDDLTPDEIAGLLFMREEEKLAFDVYIAMFNLGYPKVFDNISNSEQTHTDAVLALLNKYNIPDPVGNNAEGVFTDPYLQTLYDDLVTIGSPSLINALSVGAEIEEIDLIDIQEQVDKLEGNEDIAIVYENLMKGSRNHLRAFVNNLEKQGVDYLPTHLSQEEYDAIINGGLEN